MSELLMWLAVPAGLTGVAVFWKTVAKPSIIELAKREAVKPTLDELAMANPPVLERLDRIEGHLGKLVEDVHRLCEDRR